MKQVIKGAETRFGNRPFVRAILLLVLLALPGLASAQVIQSITSATPDFGTIVSAPSGPSIFRSAANSGTITQVSGTATRLTNGNSRAMVTLACNQNACRNTAIAVRVGSTGSPTGRVDPLANFTIAAGTASFQVAPSGTNPVSFTLRPIGTNGGTVTFFIGADLPVEGNESAASPGNATSAFYVYIAPSGTTPTLATTSGPSSGAAIARVLRPIAIVNTTPLAFGRILRPSTGSGSVELSASTGSRTVEGTGALGLASPAPTRAGYSVSGEGGQAFSISVPPTFLMTGPGTPLSVSLTSTASGSQTLSGALGAAGSLSFFVGGSFPLNSTTAHGQYSGSFTVTVEYN
jgi:hypothetical protein